MTSILSPDKLQRNSTNPLSSYVSTISDETTNLVGSGSKRSRKKTNPWIRKPMWALSDEVPGKEDENFTESSRSLQRHLSLFDLISIGVSATIGSGVFVLCGLIAHDYAGPATFISWSIAGLSACASGLCYAELSGKFASAGSSYSYVYASMGELPAVVAGGCLTLEYVFSASAVARSWGDKVVSYVQSLADLSEANEYGGSVRIPSWLFKLLDPGYNINPAAFVVSAASVIVLLNGVRESQRVTNIFTIIKVSLVSFMCLAALKYIQPENLVPMFPTKFGGMKGVIRGTTSSFFGFIGYDEICCMGSEAINPKRNLPRAVMGTILLVTVLYVLAAFALVGMVPYDEISVTSGFPDGFRYRGKEWAAQISALGEIITLPIVVLVTVMAQPRLQFAMAQDGLLPPIFASIDDSGNLWHGTFISGALCVVVATCVPFVYLNDLISAGILLAFSMTDASVILLRQSSPEGRPFLLQKLLFAFNLISLMLGILFQTGFQSLTWQIVSGLHIFALFMISLIIGFSCPKIIKDEGEDFFETPFVPYLPLVGQFLNCYLIGQLEIQGLLMLLGYTCLSIIFYFSYGAKHSFGNTIGWRGSEESCGSDSSTSVSESIGVAKHQEISLVGEHDSSSNLVEVDQHDINDDDVNSSENSGSGNDGISIYSEKPLKM